MSCLGLGPSSPTDSDSMSVSEQTEPRKKAGSFTEPELWTLETFFMDNPSPDQKTYELLANQLNVPTAQVQVTTSHFLVPHL